jgi:Zn-dependent protease with chaperone function
VRRSLFGILGAVIAVFALLAGPAGAAQDDGKDADWDTPSNTCHLSLGIFEGGTATVSLAIPLQKPSDLRLEQIEQALAKALGASLRNVRRNQSPNLVTIIGRAEKAFPPTDGRIEGDLDMARLAELLHPMSVDQIDVSITDMLTPVRTLSSMRMRTWQYEISTASPQPVHFVLADRPAGLTRAAGILAGLFLAPIAIVLGRRWAVLRAADLEPALAWYRFWRWVHWITLGTWVVWLTVVAALRDNESLPLSLGGVAGFAAVQWIVMVVPPWIVMLVCSAVSQDVFARLTKAELTKREILQRASAGIAARLLPLLLAAIGIGSVLQGGYQTGILWLAAALIVRIVGSRLALPGQGLAPHAVTTGELRDRIFTLARQAGVALKQLYILPTGKMPQANAFAMRGGNVIITDHLLQSLSRREVDAIAAHELGHLKFHHPTWLLGIFFAVILAPIFWEPLLPYWWQMSWLRYVPVSLVLALVGLYFVSRRFEYQTDSYAAWLTGDAEALITGLIKVHKLSLLPMRWGKWEEGLVTHPSTDRRLEAIARQNGISRQQLQEIVDRADLTPRPPSLRGNGEEVLLPSPLWGGAGGEVGHPQDPSAPYSLPQHLSGKEVIFSTALKSKYLMRIARTFFAAVLLVPGLVAAAAWWGGLTGPAQWGALAGGVILTAAVVVVLTNYLPLWAYGEVRRRLSEKLNAQGIPPLYLPPASGGDTEGGGGIFVTLAPDSEPRLYEGFTNWDFGFLFLLADRLYYVGEQTRFALRRDQVPSLHLGGGIPRWWPAPHLYLTWKDPERGTEGTFNVRPGQVRSMRQLRRETQNLEHTLRHWLEERPAADEIPSALADLSSPAIGEVTSAPVQTLLRPQAWLRESGLVFLLGIALSVLLGLPLRPEEGGIAWYTPIVAVLAIWVQKLPLLMGRRFRKNA